MFKEWLQLYWQEIVNVFTTIGKSDFDLLPLFKNPLFDIGLIALFLVLLFLRLYRILSLFLAGMVFTCAWSYFVGKYGNLESVPLVHWWYLVGIGIILIGALIYYWLIILGE